MQKAPRCIQGYTQNVGRSRRYFYCYRMEACSTVSWGTGTQCLRMPGGVSKSHMWILVPSPSCKPVQAPAQHHSFEYAREGGLGVTVSRMIVTVVLETIITYLVSASNQDSEETLLAVLLFIVAFAVSAVSQCGVLGDEGDMADSYCDCT
ncbi:hypothetical protein CY34DRAFT_298720 [Suillus luteus UH-Slu-Lm8-n1]|uniref:Uncharacterized protein n=1 Tax=Suillus luteus UH-Slu-Lm8-n1 TaxID=930992 RepID=A0A0D0B012_9AGAM|nr:hypothetical protein CY34DRAFT_298720 [Suillus luteus UH-Slu-Lm8-n1]